MKQENFDCASEEIPAACSQLVCQDEERVRTGFIRGELGRGQGGGSGGSEGEERAGEGLYWSSPTRRVSNIDTRLLTSQKQRRLISDWLENAKSIWEIGDLWKRTFVGKDPNWLPHHHPNKTNTF